MNFLYLWFFQEKIEPLSFQEAMTKKRNSPGLNCSTALIILPKLACGQALHWGELREVTREQHAKGDTSARGGKRKRQLATISHTFSFPPQKAQETTKHENCYNSIPGAKYYNFAQRKDLQKKIIKIVVCMDFLVWIVAYKLSRIYNISWIQRKHVASIWQSCCILFKILHQQKTHLLFSTVSKSGYADTPIRSGWVSAYPPILGGCFKVAGYSAIKPGELASRLILNNYYRDFKLPFLVFAHFQVYTGILPRKPCP